MEGFELPLGPVSVMQEGIPMRSLIRVIYLFTDSYQGFTFVLPPPATFRPANVSFVRHKASFHPRGDKAWRYHGCSQKPAGEGFGTCDLPPQPGRGEAKARRFSRRAGQHSRPSRTGGEASFVKVTAPALFRGVTP